ncbi:hypothetical protein NOR_04526 [Metarhizium rileyi]|uniref:Uncharacterized protein n=1 Tax=Metarhizium rileyi (strain RCEF 4871) TaxID=1649241 RepID=A0A167E134_METRR|nr:hypothetical protein NOR_04526 [Metarhizium rileyi RCEF 4871]
MGNMLIVAHGGAAVVNVEEPMSQQEQGEEEKTPGQSKRWRAGESETTEYGRVAGRPIRPLDRNGPESEGAEEASAKAPATGARMGRRLVSVSQPTSQAVPDNLVVSFFGPAS